MREWLERLLDSRIPALLDLLSNAWWLFGLLLAGLIWALSRLGLLKRCSKRDLEKCIRDLEPTDEPMQLKARQKLIACGERAVSLLTESIAKTDSEKQREMVVNVLCEIGAPALKQMLVARKRESIAPCVDGALEEYLPKVVEHWQYQQKHASAWKKFWDRSTHSEQIVDRLIALLNDDDPIVQEGAALALGQYHGEKVVRTLGRKLYPTECRNQKVREMVANSLGQTKQAEAIPFLTIGLSDRSRDVRIAACQALSLLKEPEAVSGLEEMLLPLEEPLVRIKAAKALGRIGGLKAREILDRVWRSLPDDDDDHRELRQIVGEESTKLWRESSGRETI